MSEGPAPDWARPAVRVVIADDHPVLIESLTWWLEDAVDLVGSAHDGIEALALIEQNQPDVALLDIQMPGLTGVDVLRRLGPSGPAIILYTATAERSQLLEALDLGARGFVLKESSVGDLIEALRIVGGGGTYVDAGLVRFLSGPDATERLPDLTPRHREILRKIADGKRNEEVAQELEISASTVKSHIEEILKRLGADSRTEAVATAIRQSLID